MLYCEHLQTVRYRSPADFAGVGERQAMSDLPPSGLVVVDLSQFLSGPYCSLRLMDLGARVIKVERPDGEDLSRGLYLSDKEIGGDSTIFPAINRGKESLAIDVKSEADLAVFRPGVIERLGLDHAQVRAPNPRLVYASIGGYGEEGPWVSPGPGRICSRRRDRG